MWKNFPNSEQKFHVRNMLQHFQQTSRGDNLKNVLWKIVRSNIVDKWEASMKEMKAICREAYAWLEEIQLTLGLGLSK
jgi:hypothetical protein